MSSHSFPTRRRLPLFLATTVASALLSVSAQAASSDRPTDVCTAQSEPYVLRVNLREVVVEVIATDSHDNPVRDLSENDLLVFELPKGSKKLERKISAFRLVDPALVTITPQTISDDTSSTDFHITIGGGCAISTTFHYQVAFHPSPNSLTAGFHEILITTTRPHIKLSFHRRYYVGETTVSAKPRVRGDSHSEADLQEAACLHSQTPPTIALKAHLIQTAFTEPLRYTLIVQPDSLAFASLSDDVRRVQLDYGACTFNSQGKPISYNRTSAERVLTPAEYANIRTSGYPNLIQLPRKEDAVLVRFVVRDRETGNIGSIEVSTTIASPVQLTRAEKEAAKKVEDKQARKTNTSSSARNDPSAGFGSILPKPGALCGDVYELPENTKRMPSSFWDLDAVGAIYTYALNEPIQYVPNGIPGVTSRPEWFAIDYHGEFWITDPGEYRFVLMADDGERFVIDDQELIYNDSIHPALEVSHTLRLTSGSHTIHLSYFQGPMRVALTLKIKPPGKDLRLFDLRDFARPTQTD